MPTIFIMSILTAAAGCRQPIRMLKNCIGISALTVNDICDYDTMHKHNSNTVSCLHHNRSSLEICQLR